MNVLSLCLISISLFIAIRIFVEVENTYQRQHFIIINYVPAEKPADLIEILSMVIIILLGISGLYVAVPEMFHSILNF